MRWQQAQTCFGEGETMKASAEFKKAVQELLVEASAHQKLDHHNEAWQRLAEAHIISQPFAGLHTLVHLYMLKAALRQRSISEIVGQLLRVLVAAPGSWFKHYPVGNTGLSNVSMFKPMPISQDLQDKIRKLR